MTTIEDAQSATQATTYQESHDFTSLLQQKLKLKGDDERNKISQSVTTLAKHILSENHLTISDNVFATIDAIIAEIDQRLSTQINEVIHHSDFQQLEGSWRGLYHLVSKSKTGETLKIKTLNISKKELGDCLKKFPDASYKQSPLYRKIYLEELDTFGGMPFGMIVGDYYFDYSSPDVTLLENISNICADAHTPFITGTSPQLLQMESWKELSAVQDVSSKFSLPEYAAWNALRKNNKSAYLGLCMPRYLSRESYGINNPVDEFNFEEHASGQDENEFTWSNSAFAMATNINKAFTEHGWCTNIRGVESGGMVQGLPIHTFTSEGGTTEMTCPTEISISGTREMELSNTGIMPLQHYKNSNQAVFVGGQSLHKPQIYDDSTATANAKLSARLPYLFACCRFAHYLKFIIRDKLAQSMERGELQSWLTDWINRYVDGDPANSTQAIKAKKPLAMAEVILEEDEDDPGYYQAQFNLRPHFQLEGIDVTLSLVSKVNSNS